MPDYDHDHDLGTNGTDTDETNSHLSPRRRRQLRNKNATQNQEEDHDLFLLEQQQQQQQQQQQRDRGDSNNTNNAIPQHSYTGKKPNPESMRSPPSRNVIERDDYQQTQEGEDGDHQQLQLQQLQQQQQQQQQQQTVHPAQALTDRALALRKAAKIKNQQDAKDATNHITYKFIPDPRLTNPPTFSGTIEAVKIGPHKSSQTYIAATIYRIRPDRITNKTKTIIYSHGNATDIGAMYFMQVIMAKGLQCNVIMYDYSGYGASGGVPLEHRTYQDIEMVYDYALRNVVQNGDERHIVIYGQSVGSGPSCYICSKRPGVGGLILHSPFMSGMRVLTPSRYVDLLCWFFIHGSKLLGHFI